MRMRIRFVAPENYHRFPGRRVYPGRRISPLFEVGPAFRITAHNYSPNHSHYGVSGGIGISTHLKKMKVSPTLRYTRWAQDKKIRGLESSTVTGPNLFEVVVGFSF